MTFTLLAALGTHLWHPRAPVWFEQKQPLGADEVTLAMVAEKWRGDVLWIDARPRTAYLASHVQGALLLNEQEADHLLDGAQFHGSVILALVILRAQQPASSWLL